MSPGSVVAGHRIVCETGRGGMGVVYEATHVRLGVTRALKVLDEGAASDPTFRARFEQEARLAASLEHPHVVPVYATGEVADTLYISMRFVRGANLQQILASEGPLSPPRVGTLITQLADALDTAHERGLVHRDVKPANVLVERDPDGEQVLLGDFGVSRLVRDPSDLTRSGEMLGTVDYVAPEQLAGGPIDGRADVYSLACVAFECLTGEPPFRRATQLATMFAHANDPRPKLTRDLGAAVEDVLARALAIAPAERYDTAGSFAADLDAALRGEEVSAPKVPQASRRRLAFAAAVLGAIVAVAAVVVASGVFSGDQVRPEKPPDGSGPVAPAARVVATLSLDSRPTALALGALNLWVASATDGTVTPVVPAAADSAGTPTSLGGRPVSMAVGFQSVWAADQAGDALVRLDPELGTAPLRIDVGDAPSAVGVSASHVWVVNRATASISRINPAVNAVDLTKPVGGAPAAMVIGEGGLWIADPQRGTVVERDPVSGNRRGGPIRIGGRPTALAAGEAGIWVLDSAGSRVVRVSVGSRSVSPAVDLPSEPIALTTGFGYVWVALADGTVQRVDPTLLEPAGQPIQVGARPEAMVAGSGHVWTADVGDSTLSRIAPR